MRSLDWRRMRSCLRWRTIALVLKLSPEARPHISSEEACGAQGLEVDSELSQQRTGSVVERLVGRVGIDVREDLPSQGELECLGERVVHTEAKIVLRIGQIAERIGAEHLHKERLTA